MDEWELAPLHERFAHSTLSLSALFAQFNEYRQFFPNLIFVVHHVRYRQLLAHPRQGFIGWFVRQALSGDVIELYGEGRQRRDVNYVDDVVEALLLAGGNEKADGGFSMSVVASLLAWPTLRAS